MNFKGQVIFIRMAEYSDLKEKDVYLVPCFKEGQKCVGELEMCQLN